MSITLPLDYKLPFLLKFSALGSSTGQSRCYDVAIANLQNNMAAIPL
ncbi:Uncharacterised protein [Yersinia massiliensis]|nr:Uncharacterised protein [Yersinia massiliensis]